MTIMRTTMPRPDAWGEWVTETLRWAEPDAQEGRDARDPLHGEWADEEVAYFHYFGGIRGRP